MCYRTQWSNMSHYHWSLKNHPIPHTQTHNFLCMSDTTKHMQYTPSECSTTRMNDSVDDQDTYIWLEDIYIHLIQLDQHYTIISPDTQWYHTAHLPISTPEMTHTLVNQNPRTYIMWTSQLPITPTIYLLSTCSLVMPVVSWHSLSPLIH